MANFIVGRLGKSFNFDLNKSDSISGDIDAINCVLLLAKHNPNDTFYIIGANNWDKTVMMDKPENVKSIIPANAIKGPILSNPLCFVEMLKDIKIDGGILFQSISSNVKYMMPENEQYNTSQSWLNFVKSYQRPIFCYLEKTKIPYVMFYTDPRQWPLAGPIDLRNLPKKILTQTTDNLKPIKKSFDETKPLETTEYSISVEYNGAEKIAAYNINVVKDFSEKRHEKLTLLANDDKRNKRIKQLAPYMQYDPELIVYGKWDEKCTNKWPNLKGPIPPTRIHDLYKKEKYTLIIPIDDGWVTFKYLEMIAYGVIPFFHPTYDSKRFLDVPEYIRIKTPEELYQKIEQLENDPELYLSIITELQEKFLTQDVLDGSFMNNQIMGAFR